MKVIFLDIDGVLNSNEWNDTHPLEISNGNYIDEEKVKLLSTIINKTNANIVMHSGWRFCFNEKMEPESKEVDLLLSIFKKYEIAIFDKTPDFSTAEIRKSKNSV